MKRGLGSERTSRFDVDSKDHCWVKSGKATAG